MTSDLNRVFCVRFPSKPFQFRIIMCPQRVDVPGNHNQMNHDEDRAKTRGVSVLWPNLPLVGASNFFRCKFGHFKSSSSSSQHVFVASLFMSVILHQFLSSTARGGHPLLFVVGLHYRRSLTVSSCLVFTPRPRQTPYVWG